MRTTILWMCLTHACYATALLLTHLKTRSVKILLTMSSQIVPFDTTAWTELDQSNSFLWGGFLFWSSINLTCKYPYFFQRSHIAIQIHVCMAENVWMTKMVTPVHALALTGELTVKVQYCLLIPRITCTNCSYYFTFEAKYWLFLLFVSVL